MPADWSKEEIEVTVAEYFAMLRAELAGLPYKKSVHNERARRLLDDRSRASVEYKFRNISAVLVNQEQMYVAWISAESELSSGSRDCGFGVAGRRARPCGRGAVPFVPRSAAPSRIPSFTEVLTDAPNPKHAARMGGRTVVKKIDFLRLDTENRSLGARGEEFVLELEQRRLQDDEGRRDLSKKVRWVARDDGDGLRVRHRVFRTLGRDAVD